MELPSKQKFYDFIYGRLVDSTSISVASTPLFLLPELYISKFTHYESVDTRLLAITIIFAGISIPLNKGRELFSKYVKFPEKMKGVQDAIYMGTFNLAFAPFFYLLSGIEDFQKLATATSTAVLYGLGSGPFIGYTMDSFKDLMGITNTENTLTESTRNFHPSFRKAIAAGITAATLAYMIGIYHVTPDNEERSYQTIDVITQQAQSVVDH